MSVRYWVGPANRPRRGDDIPAANHSQRAPHDLRRGFSSQTRPKQKQIPAGLSIDGKRHPSFAPSTFLVMSGGDPDQDAVPAQPTKRQLDTVSEINPLPAKRARLAQTDVQPSGVGDEKAEPTDKVCPCSPMQVNR